METHDSGYLDHSSSFSSNDFGGKLNGKFPKSQ